MSRHARAALLIALIALAVRFANIGNPLPAIDEQFYLLVGDRMLGGALPYVDIWDRKPIGLFLIFASVRLLGGSGIVEYQLVATGFAIATALLVYAFALRRAPWVGALMAGVAYLLWLNLASGEGGQSPVFYNLPMVAAALIVARQFDHASVARLRLWGCVAMLLAGLAIQIKYTAVFEGFFFGVTLMWLRWRRAPGPGLIVDAALWAAIALAPTALALAAYWRLGHSDAFMFANFGSIAARGGLGLREAVERLLTLAVILGPLLAFGIRGKPTFERIWLWVALAALVGFGTWFDHYALPVIAPAAIAAAPVWASGRARIAALTLFAVAAIVGQVILKVERDKRGWWDTVAAMRTAMAGQRNCPFIYDGPPGLYLLGDWCTPTSRPFPAHFNFMTERDAVGFETDAEIERIMKARPDRVMTKEPGFEGENIAARTRLYRHLARDYARTLRIPSQGKYYAIYALRSGRAPQPNAWPASAQPAPSSQPPSTSTGQ